MSAGATDAPAAGGPRRARVRRGPRRGSRSRGIVCDIAAWRGHARGRRRPARGLHTVRALSRPARRDRRRRRLARLRLLRRHHRPVRLGRRCDRGLRRADHAPDRAPATGTRGLQRVGAGDRRRRGRDRDRTAGRRRRAQPRRAGGRGCVRALQPEHGADQPRDRCERREAVQGRDPLDAQRHDAALRADGLGVADPRRPLAALPRALGRARRAAARDRSLPTLDVPGAPRDAACADRPAHGPRQPPPLPRPARARARRLAGAGLSAQPLPRGHRRLQAHQRPLRPSRRRQGAGAARDEAPPGRRGLPARRGRVRDPAPRPRRGRRCDRRAGHRRAGSPATSSTPRARSPSAPGSRPCPRRESSATSS